MQMYKVSFQTHYPDIIDVGEVLICAANADLAAEIARENLKLPASTTVFEVERVKPSIYTLSRKEVLKHANAKAFSKNGGEEPALFMVAASCSIKAYSEMSAWRRFSGAISERASAKKALIEKSGIRDLEMLCERKELTARSPAIDLQSIYKSPRIFAGGAARGK